MPSEQIARVSDDAEIASGAARFRRYLIGNHVRFAAFWSILIVGGVLVGIVSFRAELYGFAFSGFVGALAASMMVWLSTIHILDIRSRSDRQILFLGPPKQSTAPAGDQASTESPPSA